MEMFDYYLLGISAYLLTVVIITGDILCIELRSGN